MGAEAGEGISELCEALLTNGFDMNPSIRRAPRPSFDLDTLYEHMEPDERAVAEKARRRRKSIEWANSLPERRWKLSLERSPTATATGDGLYEGIDWLSNAISSAK